MINKTVVILSLLLVTVFTSCKSTRECSTQPKTSLFKHKEKHSAHWYTQQSIARQLKKMSQEESDAFFKMYFPTDDNHQKLDSLLRK
jgi:hypothetical protein